MHTLGAGATVIIGFLMANVVAGGVFLVFHPALQEYASDDALMVGGGVLIGALAVACAVFFFIGFAHTLQRRPR